ncbi:LamB/YcsF family protein [Salinisphaera sp. Q1T1-3]|uniref:LamB/YcsF family protein n=1 Tax=Salinisphaera sp. Q1T1-3 TaxID=2321229 RepID=UPI000E70751A|nr:5-oxoprolinase subunit PxpA [Salinisphaera sp. Q1T1-3]RJS91137.1 LamB/YcsF family protein [Salinisphaera sp. Q1T1-3]
MPTIDLNADVGESFGRWQLGDDAAMFESVTSGNIACGFHAGDPSTIRATCRAAVDAGVSIGAHVAYRDLAGFGRRFVDCASGELADDVLYQLGALDAFARAAGGRIGYIKPHGALYHAMIDHEPHARAVIEALRAFDPTLPILALPGARVLELADTHGIRGVAEAFADRAYNADGTLVSRRKPDALIKDDETIVANMIRLAEDGVIIARDGTQVRVAAESICVHGDSPGAVTTAQAVRRALDDAGITIAAFA